MKLLTILAAATLAMLASCATPPQAHSDHDRAQDFSGYRNYAWIADQPMIMPPEGAAQVSPLNRRRIEEAIEKELAAKGYRKTDRADADFVLSYSVGTRDRLDPSYYPPPYAGIWHWGRGYYGATASVDVYREGTLSIDVFDARSHEPVWHGWTSGRVTERDVRHAAELIPPAVTAILRRFPPK